MPRYAFKIEYHGAPFCGWQRQADQPSVQEALETALRKLAPGLQEVAGAGRTDTGVHAIGQVAHCDLATRWDTFRLSEALNFHLKPQPVSITACTEVAADWHARFSAIGRKYVFKLLSRRAPAVHNAGLVWQVRHDLHLKPMQDAAQHLIGLHDFTTFRSSMCQAQSPLKTLDRLQIEQIDLPFGCEFHFTVEARSFLHNQVRSFIGTLERVGAGAWSPDQVKQALEARSRAACGPVSPPQGLYLHSVKYPQNPF